MNTCAQYIALCKVALGDSRMSDRELGGQLGGYAQPTIAEAKTGRMSINIALEIGDILFKHGLVKHAGEVILVALAESKTGRARATLLDYAKNVVTSAPLKAIRALGALVVALGMLLPSSDVRAAVPGGEGRH